MNADEQKLLSGLFDRTRQAADTTRDPEAERFIVDQIKSQPSAPYLLAQAVIVQEQGLNACHERIQALEAQVKDLQNAAPAQPQSGGLLGSIFGSSQSAQSSPPSPGRFSGPWGGAAPQDGYAPQGQPQQAGRWAAPLQSSAQGGGFLQGALSTAAGVAGGALMFEGIKNMMGGNSLFGGSGGGTGSVPQSGAGETVINNYYNDDKNTDTQNNDAEMDRLDDAYDDSLDTDTDDDNVA
ncbi:DUF2076 domain-containing protein [Phyllobacterium myrsinacearum]|uniref:DUF2076 domain-containing protein n=1 Tax=Phyllobacterium myrsinacearum TaxID=28101 RepID=A0A839EUQ4_9HYPH|nr:DUF2076 domain-containing protein [Phyllobacterium myrsinacearum]MBA8881056.1 hypothetical protein [Phyllobacterium myrsinacearum]